MQPIYLDNAATTRVYKEVLDAMEPYHTCMYFNTSSAYSSAVDCEEMVKRTENAIKRLLGARKGNLIFTSGGTESINTVLFGVASKTRKTGICTTEIEHSASLQACVRVCEDYGHKLSYLPFDERGYIIAGDIGKAVTSDTYLVSFIHVNNETGIIQDVKRVTEEIKSINPDCLVHVDGVQAFCKIGFDLEEAGVDFYSVSSHKIHGPKGIGALYIRDPASIKPMMVGGGHQYGLRAGTVNTPGIAGFGKAVEMAARRDSKTVYEIKWKLYEKLKSEIDDMMVIGDDVDKTSPYILNVAFKDIRGETLLHCLEAENILVSTGSACSAKNSGASHVLKAMGIGRDYINGSIRISFSDDTTDGEAQYAGRIIIDNVKRLRRFA